MLHESTDSRKILCPIASLLINHGTINVILNNITKRQKQSLNTQKYFFKYVILLKLKPKLNLTIHFNFM